MNEEKEKQGLSTLTMTALAIPLVLLLAGVVVLSFGLNYSGAASLPNGNRLTIEGQGLGFTISETKDLTRVEAGGAVLNFGRQEAEMNGIETIPIESGKDYHVQVSRNSISVSTDGESVYEVSR